MDLLDRVLLPGHDLLRRVDQTLTTVGFPPDHPIVPLLRAVGALPGESLECVAALRPDAFADFGIELRNRADGYAGRRAQVAAEVARTSWEGTAGLAFAAHWKALGEYLGDGEGPDEPSMAGGLLALRGYLDEICDWISGARREFAITLAEVIGSMDAVRILGSDPDAAAAATVGAKVLTTADAVIHGGFHLIARWQHRLGDLPFAAARADTDGSGPTRVEL